MRCEFPEFFLFGRMETGGGSANAVMKFDGSVNP